MFGNSSTNSYCQVKQYTSFRVTLGKDPKLRYCFISVFCGIKLCLIYHFALLSIFLRKEFLFNHLLISVVKFLSLTKALSGKI